MMCVLFLIFSLSSCNAEKLIEEETTAAVTMQTTAAETTTVETTTVKPTERTDIPVTVLLPGDKTQTLDNGFKVVRFSGDDALDNFIEGGGAKSNDELMEFLIKCVLYGKAGIKLGLLGASCSTLSVKGENSMQYFGRNFDWKKCNGLIIVNEPKYGYKSVSTVNSDFMDGADYELTDEVRRFVGLYCPLDGMNEKGVCISVNMITSVKTIEQNTSKPDLTTTSAIRLILDRTSSAKEAVEILKGYDMHASFGYMVHFAVCDSTGYSVAVEYADNEMIVTETPVLTNFYVAPGLFGTGSKSSIKRYDILCDLLGKKDVMSFSDVLSAMKSVGKSNFDDPVYNSTEWTVIFNQTTKTASYFHRENFDRCWQIEL